MIKNLAGRLSIEWARLWPSELPISMMREINEIQLSPEQLKMIAMTVREKTPCKMLVFGLGNDSLYWHKLNRHGDTVFIEDNKDWFQIITNRSKALKAFLVHYRTRIKDWERLLEDPSLLKMSLPSDVERKKWDIIIVDAPEGWHDQAPGRMKSIYQSSKLIKNSGDVFVHDCDREIEDVYCGRFLKKENLKREIQGPFGLLRHYRMENRDRCF